MKVILKQLVPNVGKEGQVVNVRNGYARNFLFPRGLAIVADDNQLRALDRRNAREEAKLSATKTEAASAGTTIEGKVVRIPGKVGKETGKLFGAVTAGDVADAIKEQLGVVVDRKQVGVLHPIKRLGDTQVTIGLHRDVDATVTVRVFDPANPEATEPAVESVAADSSD